MERVKSPYINLVIILVYKYYFRAIFCSWRISTQFMLPLPMYYSLHYRVSINGYTPCHAAALGGRSPRFPHGIYEARNPIIGLRLWMEGLRNILSYHLHDSNSQRRCLEYLICFGGDWKLTSHKQENTKDIAVQRMKESIVEMIKEYSELFFVFSGLMKMF